jgi:hypothetical protein
VITEGKKHELTQTLMINATEANVEGHQTQIFSARPHSRMSPRKISFWMSVRNRPSQIGFFSPVPDGTCIPMPTGTTAVGNKPLPLHPSAQRGLIRFRSQRLIAPLRSGDRRGKEDISGEGDKSHGALLASSYSTLVASVRNLDVLRPSFQSLEILPVPSKKQVRSAINSQFCNSRYGHDSGLS